ncbi:hypothetical protein MTP99_008745 [Tenebrio molitor]|nr:hypothetical protein MTP99_008745 [Tenebrio molitor]
MECSELLTRLRRGKVRVRDRARMIKAPPPICSADTLRGFATLYSTSTSTSRTRLFRWMRNADLARAPDASTGITAQPSRPNRPDQTSLFRIAPDSD